LAAAGIHALHHNIDRLTEDHANARLLAEGLAAIDSIDIASVQTNMVFAAVAEHKVAGLAEHLKGRGILIMLPIAGALRLVTHLDVEADSVRTAIAAFSEYLA
jgi:threonine aldolase